MRIEEPPRLALDLKTIKLPTVAAHGERLALEAHKRRQPHADYLAELLALEVAQRREGRIRRLTQEARFPVLKTLDGFDFAAQPSLDRDAILDLARGDFVRERRNVVFVGGVGTGKTHLAIALGLACCQKELRVRFTSAAELTNLLVEAKAEGRLSRKLEQLARYDLVLLDELGYVPFDRHGADLLFGFVAKVYQRRSLVVTTNLPFARWSEVVLDATAAAAVIDRIVHHATVLKTEGDSYRLKAARQGGRKRKEVEPTGRAAAVSPPVATLLPARRTPTSGGPFSARHTGPFSSCRCHRGEQARDGSR
ncbi:MAG: IS21-like element helper ATPase IstB, partial [Planctomycetota bacterium]